MGQSAIFTTAAGLANPIFGPEPQEVEQEKSGLVTGKPVGLNYEDLGGFLSKDQIRWHHESHYGGALKSYVKLDQDVTGSHRLRIAKANSVLLHELYFENMSANPMNPGKLSTAAIKSRFGSMLAWSKDFQIAAKSCRGWAMLACHPVSKKLYNVCTDSHDDGLMCSGIPLVVIDLYEHAYYLDFQNNKAAYIQQFANHINWRVVEQRMRRLQA